MRHPMPSQLAFAHDVVAAPDRHRYAPLVIADSWARLKEARGQTVNFARLGEAHHLVAAPVEPDDSIDAARRGAIPRIRAAVEALRRGETGGDAA